MSGITNKMAQEGLNILAEKLRGPNLTINGKIKIQGV